MKSFAELPAHIQGYLMPQIRQYFGKHAKVTDRDEIQIMYPNQTYQPVHGYVAVDSIKNTHKVLICDNTPDSGDVVAISYEFRW